MFFLCALALSSSASSSDIVFTFRRALVLLRDDPVCRLPRFSLKFRTRHFWTSLSSTWGLVYGQPLRRDSVPDYKACKTTNVRRLGSGLFVHKTSSNCRMIMATLSLLRPGKPGSLPYWVRGVPYPRGNGTHSFPTLRRAWIALALTLHASYPFLHLIQFESAFCGFPGRHVPFHHHCAITAFWRSTTIFILRMRGPQRHPHWTHSPLGRRHRSDSLKALAWLRIAAFASTSAGTLNL